MKAGLRFLREKASHRRPVEHDDRENSQDGSKRHKNALDSADHEAVRVMSPPGKESSCQEDRYGQSPSHEDTCGTNDDEKPSEDKWELAAMLVRESPADRGNPHGQMDERETGKQGSYPTDDVMKDRQEPKLFFVLVHRRLSSGWQKR